MNDTETNETPEIPVSPAVAAELEATDPESADPEFADVESEDLESSKTTEASELGESEKAGAESKGAGETDGEDDAAAFPFAEELRLESQIEAIVFASPRPLRTTDIHELLCDPALALPAITLADVQTALDGLTEHYRNRCGGFHLRYIKRMGYQFQTVPAAARLMEKQFAARPRPISRAAMETLSIIAYRQPVTRADVEYIRGVDAGSIMKGLLERGLIACSGRKEIAGRPMLFSTTDEFLKVFQIGNVKDLPPLESFQPPAELLEGAMEKLAEASADEAEGSPPDHAVDLEDFIGDEEYAAVRQGATAADPMSVSQGDQIEADRPESELETVSDDHRSEEE